MNANKFLLLIFLSGCATHNSSFKEKTFRNMLVASALGVLAGQNEKDNKGSFSLIYTGLAASAAAVGSIMIYDPDHEIEQCSGVSKQVANSLENAISGHNQTNEHSYQSYYQKKGDGLKNFSSLPNKYKSLVTPGEWKLSQISEWEQIDDFTLVHKTELLEIKPPELNINK